jgi:hypothetical protein
MQLAFRNLSKLASAKRIAAGTPSLVHHLNKRRYARTRSVSQHVRASRSAFGALVSFIEVPQSMEVPPVRNLPPFELFFLSSFQNTFKNQHAKLHERPLPLVAI